MAHLPARTTRKFPQDQTTRKQSDTHLAAKQKLLYDSFRLDAFAISGRRFSSRGAASPACIPFARGGDLVKNVALLSPRVLEAQRKPEDGRRKEQHTQRRHLPSRRLARRRGRCPEQNQRRSVFLQKLPGDTRAPFSGGERPQARSQGADKLQRAAFPPGGGFEPRSKGEGRGNGDGGEQTKGAAPTSSQTCRLPSHFGQSL